MTACLCTGICKVPPYTCPAQTYQNLNEMPTLRSNPWICPRCTTVNAPWMPFCCKDELMRQEIERLMPEETLSVCSHGRPIKLGCDKCHFRQD